MRFLSCLFLSIAVPSLCASPHAGGGGLPLYRIDPARSLYEAGLAHGAMAKDRILGFLATAELQALLAFVQPGQPGHFKLKQLKADNERAFPRFADEVRGIAEGAGISIQTGWAINLLQELENFMRPQLNVSDHCSDLFATDAGSVWHGHNEDWSTDVGEWVYMVAYAATEDASFMPCAGFVYPGMIPGSALSFNPYGIAYTQNALFPAANRAFGLASNFVNRAACEQTSLQDVHRVSSVLNQTMGFSLNVVSVHEKAAANFEVYEDACSRTLLPTDRPANSSHFNHYKHVQPAPVESQGPLQASSTHRQARVDALPPVRTGQDILQVLGDHADPDYPLYRTITLMTSLLDGATGVMQIWSQSNPASSDPLYTWNILSFWE